MGLRWLVGFFVWLACAVSAAAEPVFSIDITLASGGDFGAAVADIRSVGAEATSLSLLWDDLEQRPGIYSPDNDWPTIANTYYPGLGLSVTLTFSVIDTGVDRRPADLRGLPWDDPKVISRFETHLDAVLDRMTDTRLTGIAVGNEVDGVLTTAEDIAAFSAFLAAAWERIESRRPGLFVGTKLTFSGFTDPLYRPLVEASSAGFVTYYPLEPDFSVRGADTVEADLTAMASAAAGLPLFIAEAGYPSDGCGGTPEAQRDFALALLNRVSGMDEVVLVSLTWLHDIPGAQVEAYADYYGVGTDCFARFLGSLGLKSERGTAKPVFDALRHRR